MVERIREGFERVVYGDRSRQRMSQREADAYRRQLVILGVTVTTVLVVLILAIGAVYQYVYLPRQTVASVAGHNITRSEYWDYRKYELLGQWRQYQQMMQMVGAEQAQQYQQMAADAARDYREVERSPVDPFTVNEMIENRILVMSLDEFDLEITDAAIDRFLIRYFTGMTIGDPIPTPEVDPTALAWAEATAEARQAEFEAQQAELEAQQEEQELEQDQGQDDADNGEPAVDDAADEEGVADDVAEPDPTPEPTPTIEPTPTPSEEEIRATATVVEGQHQEFVLEEAGISEQRFIDLIVKPEIARELIGNRLASDVPARTEQVHAAHILVATEEAANLIYNESLQEREFADVARDQSADPTTADNGGDLGWFPRGVMVPEFEAVAFSLEPGEISEPFQSQFGWHIVKVIDRDDDRPVDSMTLGSLRGQVFETWLQEKKASVDIDTRGLPEIDTAAPPPTQFTPPPAAPPAPVPTPDPDAEQFDPQPFDLDDFDIEDLIEPPEDEDDQ